LDEISGIQICGLIKPRLAGRVCEDYTVDMSSVDQLASEALLLPEDQRFSLANRILASVEPGEDTSSVDAAWDAEIRERIAHYDAGLTPALPGAQVLSELDAQLHK